MHPTLILTFLFAATTWAAQDRVFYAKVNDKFQMIPISQFKYLDTPNLEESKSRTAPIFTLESTGVAFTGEAPNKKYFGYANKSMIIGEQIWPFQLQMDLNSRVLNLFIKECHYISGNSPGELNDNKNTTSSFKCSPAELYLLTPMELLSQLHESEGLQKREDEEESEDEGSEESEKDFFVKKRHVLASKSTLPSKKTAKGDKDNGVHSSKMANTETASSEAWYWVTYHATSMIG